MDPSADRHGFKNNYFTEMCCGSETGSYLMLIDFVHHSTLGLRVIKKKKKVDLVCVRRWEMDPGVDGDG